MSKSPAKSESDEESASTLGRTAIDPLDQEEGHAAVLVGADVDVHSALVVSQDQAETVLREVTRRVAHQ